MVEIKKVREDKRGIKTITIPRESSIKGGDYVALRRIDPKEFAVVEEEKEEIENADK